MKKLTIACVTAIGVLTGSAAVLAQAPAPATGTSGPVIVSPANQPGPSVAPPSAQAGSYTGPSSTAVMTVKQLLDNGSDDQHARLQGRIVSHDGGKKYTFADDSGRMSVEISPRRFPAGQSISAEQRVELSGKVDKGFRSMEFEVKEIRLLP